MNFYYEIEYREIIVTFKIRGWKMEILICDCVYVQGLLFLCFFTRSKTPVCQQHYKSMRK